jgi:hypothetical protein
MKDKPTFRRCYTVYAWAIPEDLGAALRQYEDFGDGCPRLEAAFEKAGCVYPDISRLGISEHRTGVSVSILEGRHTPELEDRINKGLQIYISGLRSWIKRCVRSVRKARETNPRACAGTRRGAIYHLYGQKDDG